MDKLTLQQRHRCMAAIRSRDTKPELKVRLYQLTTKRMEDTMRGVERLLNENFLSIYRPHKPIAYGQDEEDIQMPMAAEEEIEYGHK